MSRLDLITQPEAGTGPLISAVRHAKHTIEIVIFRFNCKDLEEELKAAVARGVSVAETRREIDVSIRLI